MLLVIAVVSPLAALAFYEYDQTGRIYRGVSALGVDLSGLNRADAERLLGERAAELTARPVLVKAGDNQWRTDWRRLGLTMPVSTIVDRAMGLGRQGSIVDQLYVQIRALRSGIALPVDETLDESALRAFVAYASIQLDRPVRNARLEMKPDLSFELTTAQAGRKLDQDESVRLLMAASQSGAETVELPVAVLTPTTTDEMRLPAKTKAEAILAGPVTLSYAERSWTLDRQELADALQFTGGPGVPIEVKVDPDKLRPTMERIAGEAAQEPRDAQVQWADGALRATSTSQDGRRLDVEAALRQMTSQIEGGARSVVLPVTVTKPSIDSNNLDALGVRELIDSASTSFAGSVPQKAHNVRLAASRLNGQLIAPGERFSFNKALGPTTIDNGYQVAFGIESTPDAGHKTVPSVAGGICQVATTLFQPVFWSGYQLEERHWHLYWIPNYASKGVVGLDATVDEEVGLDLQFVNNSSTYLLIQARTDDSSVTFELYGTKPDWTVKVDGPAISDKKPADPTPVIEKEPSLPVGQRIQVEAAREGFTATFARTVTSKDGNVRTLNLRSDYVPSRNVTLEGTGGASADLPDPPTAHADGA